MVFKKKFTVEISPTAYQDIDESVVYYSVYSKRAARLFYESVFKTIDAIRKNPYYEVRFDQYRALKVHKFPFLVVFKIDERKKVVRVVTVFNTHRNVDNMKLE